MILKEAPVPHPIPFDVDVPVLVTTDNRGVFFGFVAIPHDPVTKTITLRDARCALTWPVSQRGFLGLAAQGPLPETVVGPAVPRLTATAVTSIAAVTQDALDAWNNQP